jgi:hypothetical protein
VHTYMPETSRAERELISRFADMAFHTNRISVMIQIKISYNQSYCSTFRTYWVPAIQAAGNNRHC